MAKKKKTRKQKMLAENKKEKVLSTTKEALLTPESSASHNDESFSNQYVFKMKGTVKNTQPRTSISAIHDYTHLKYDLTKTSILTTSIVVAQLVLYFILQ